MWLVLNFSVEYVECRLLHYSVNVPLIAVCKGNGKWEWFCESKWCCKNDAAKMTLQNDVEDLATQADGIISPNKPLIYFCDGRLVNSWEIGNYTVPPFHITDILHAWITWITHESQTPIISD